MDGPRWTGRAKRAAVLSGASLLILVSCLGGIVVALIKGLMLHRLMLFLLASAVVELLLRLRDVLVVCTLC